MLIYARASNELDIPDLPDLSVQAAASDGTTDILNPNDPPTVASLPSRVLELINSMNAEHEKACEEYTLRSINTPSKDHSVLTSFLRSQKEQSDRRISPKARSCHGYLPYLVCQLTRRGLFLTL